MLLGLGAVVIMVVTERITPEHHAAWPNASGELGVVFGTPPVYAGCCTPSIIVDIEVQRSGERAPLIFI